MQHPAIINFARILYLLCFYKHRSHTALLLYLNIPSIPTNFTFVLKFQETFATLILSSIFIINVDILKRNAFRSFSVFLVKIQTQNCNFIYALLSGHFTLLSRAKLAGNFSKCFDQNWALVLQDDNTFQLFFDFGHIIKKSIKTITVIFDYILTFCDVSILCFRFLWIWYWKYENFHKKSTFL